MKELEEIAPIEKLAAFILNKATEHQADKVRVELLHGSAEIGDELLEKLQRQSFVDDEMAKLLKSSSIAVKVCVDKEWQEFDPPPVYLWSNLRNLYLRWAGIEYWQKGAASGSISEDLVNRPWSFSISEDHNKLELELITKWLS
jgi:hypothetical protein